MKKIETEIVSNALCIWGHLISMILDTARKERSIKVAKLLINGDEEVTEDQIQVGYMY